MTTHWVRCQLCTETYNNYNLEKRKYQNCDNSLHNQGSLVMSLCCLLCEHGLSSISTLRVSTLRVSTLGVSPLGVSHWSPSANLHGWMRDHHTSGGHCWLSNNHHGGILREAKICSVIMLLTAVFKITGQHKLLTNRMPVIQEHVVNNSMRYLKHIITSSNGLQNTKIRGSIAWGELRFFLVHHSSKTEHLS